MNDDFAQKIDQAKEVVQHTAEEIVEKLGENELLKSVKTSIEKEPVRGAVLAFLGGAVTVRVLGMFKRRSS